MGDPEEFSAPALAADVLEAIRDHGISDAVLVGHSMGGRVAMRAAVLDAESEKPVLRAVVIEDMDLKKRFCPGRTQDLPPHSQAALEAFSSLRGRLFDTWEQARAALLPWYDGDLERVEGWRNKRVRALPGRSQTVWSDISALFV